MANDVFVKLKLDSKEFDKNIKSSEHNVNSFDGKVKKTHVSLSGLVGAFAAVGAGLAVMGVAILANAKKMGDLINTTDKYAKATGLSVKNMLAINLAFKKLGIDVDATSEGMKTFAENIGDALVAKAGPALEALTSLGIKLEDIKDLNTEEQLLIFVDALSKVERASDRTFLAIQAGGEDFFHLTQAFDLGAVKLKKLIDEQKEYTKTLNIEKIQETSNKVSEQALAWDKLSLSIAAATAQPLLDTTDWLNKQAQGISALIDLYGEWAGRDFKGGIFDDKGEKPRTRLEILDSQLARVGGGVEGGPDIGGLSNAEFKKLLAEEEAMILKRNASAELGTAEKNKQANIERGMIEQESKERAVSFEVLMQREEALNKDKKKKEFKEIEADLPGGTLGLLERGSQEEIRSKRGDENDLQKQQTAFLKELVALNKKRKKQFVINNVSV